MILRQKVLYITSILFQATASVLYGLRLLNEYGTDYGIYYAGSLATHQNGYGLYSSFFDIKGPLYYGFLKCLSFFVNYSTTGAVIQLIITALFWFLSINLACRLITTNLNIKTVASFGSVALLIGQDSNSSMSLFQSGLIALSLALIHKFLISKNISYYYLSIAMSVMAFLVKIDSFSIIVLIPLVYLFYNKIKSVFHLILGFIFSIFFYMINLLFLSKFLHFSFNNYFYQNIQFVFESRWGIADTVSNYGALGFFVRDYNSITLLLASGVFFSLSIAYQNLSLHDLKNDPGIIIVAFGFISYVVLRSDKNYHLFVLYSSLLIALILKLEKDSVLHKFKLIIGTLLLSASLVIVNFSLDSRCVITNNIQCLNRFADLLQPNEDKELLQKTFYLNQGWPFVINGVLPQNNFTVWWPLAVETKYSTTQIIDQANSSNFPIWVDYNDFIDLQKKNPLRVGQFMKGKELIRNDSSSKWGQLVPIE